MPLCYQKKKKKKKNQDCTAIPNNYSPVIIICSLTTRQLLMANCSHWISNIIYNNFHLSVTILPQLCGLAHGSLQVDTSWLNDSWQWSVHWRLNKRIIAKLCLLGRVTATTVYLNTLFIFAVICLTLFWHKADITSGLQLGRAEALRGLRNFLNIDRPEHHSIDRLKERGEEKGSSQHSILCSSHQKKKRETNSTKIC